MNPIEKLGVLPCHTHLKRYSLAVLHIVFALIITVNNFMISSIIFNFLFFSYSQVGAIKMNLFLSPISDRFILSGNRIFLWKYSNLSVRNVPKL